MCVARLDTLPMWTQYICVDTSYTGRARWHKKPPNLERLGGAFYTAQRMLGIVIAGCRLPRFTPS